MQNKKLVLFDIDHTLMDVGSSGRRVFAKAFKEILDVNIDYKHWKFHGYPDLQIIHELMDIYQVKKDQKTIVKIIKKVIARYNKADLSHACLLPGVSALLKSLKKDKNIVIGLVTGNIEECAYTKLRHFNIDEYFILGGFGHSSRVRADLVRIAIKKARSQFGKIKKGNVFIIGDTPHDIKAAKDSGVKVIAVATGIYSKKQLAKLKPDYIFSGLKYTKKITKVIKND